MNNEELTRINKHLSEIGFCSRRHADRLIEEKRVLINGSLAEMGTKVGKSDVIEIDGKIIQDKGVEHVYIMLNKPVGIVCTSDSIREKNNIIDFINYPERIYPIGRLDKDSEGLIFLTNDGEIVNKIMRARNNHEKEYIVTVNKAITPEFIKGMRSGVPILDTMTRNCEVEQLGTTTFRIILTQGLNRQIRRMSEYFGYRVKTLKRVRIMNILLDIPIGEYRHFTEEELNSLNQLLD